MLSMPVEMAVKRTHFSHFICLFSTAILSLLPTPVAGWFSSKWDT